MAGKETAIGGLAGVNQGKIVDCYCYYTAVSGRQKKRLAGKNTGSIRVSFAGVRGKILERWNAQGVAENEAIASKTDAASLGFDTDTIWDYCGGLHVMKFLDENWRIASGVPAEQTLIQIRSFEDLERFTAQVNAQDAAVMDAYIWLASDIDCKGRNLVPIGTGRQNAFRGIFDGNSHTIHNFKVEDDVVGNRGLFGYLKGAVINLSIDCKVKGEGHLGALCGVNEGLISCCGAVVALNGSGDRLQAGGLVGQNLGIIEKSYAAVRVRAAILPILPIGIAASLVLLLGLIGLWMLPKARKVDQTYAPIAADKNQIRITDQGEERDAPDRGHVFAFHFDETLHIEAATGNCYINFGNPSYSTNKLVVRLEANNADRTVMAQTGAIEPGYGVRFLDLNADGIALINEGLEEAFIVLTPYNSATDDKSMMESTLPVHITIE